MLMVTWLQLEVRAPASAGGTGQSMLLDVCYDSGCGTMAIPISDLNSIMTQDGIAALPAVRTKRLVVGLLLIPQDLKVEYSLPTQRKSSFLGTLLNVTTMVTSPAASSAAR